VIDGQPAGARAKSGHLQAKVLMLDTGGTGRETQDAGDRDEYTEPGFHLALVACPWSSTSSAMTESPANAPVIPCEAPSPATSSASRS
jgi:hypothetical protein